MMGIGTDEAKSLSWWEYSAMLAIWNERHSSDDDDPVEAPDPEFVRKREELLLAHGIATGRLH